MQKKHIYYIKYEENLLYTRHYLPRPVKKVEFLYIIFVFKIETYFLAINRDLHQIYLWGQAAMASVYIRLWRYNEIATLRNI